MVRACCPKPVTTCRTQVVRLSTDTAPIAFQGNSLFVSVCPCQSYTSTSPGFFCVCLLADLPGSTLFFASLHHQDVRSLCFWLRQDRCPKSESCVLPAGRHKLVTGNPDPGIAGLRAVMASLLSPVKDKPQPGFRPHPRYLGNVANWGVGQLSISERAALASLPSLMTIGTACSGSDCPVVALQHLASAIRKESGRNFSVKHLFSCERDPRKQTFIRENFPNLPALFDDVMDLGNGVAHNVLRGSLDTVPKCDIFVAGFVCKSVSMENPHREQFATCISSRTGITGETWQGVIDYVRFAQPAIVIFENVEGLTRGIRGREAQIIPVMSDLERAGYCASWRVLDSRHFHLPQRRRRCWIWGLLHAKSKDVAEKCLPATLQSQMYREPVTLDSLFVDEPYDEGRGLNDREQAVVDKIVHHKFEDIDFSERDWVIDVSKSIMRASPCQDACPCLVPNSRLFRVNTGQFLGPLQVLGLQGIWTRDFPGLENFAFTKPRLLRDIAGNAFTSTVALAVILLCLVYLRCPRGREQPEPSVAKLMLCLG